MKSGLAILVSPPLKHPQPRSPAVERASHALPETPLMPSLEDVSRELHESPMNSGPGHEYRAPSGSGFAAKRAVRG